MKRNRVMNFSFCGYLRLLCLLITNNNNNIQRATATDNSATRKASKKCHAKERNAKNHIVIATRRMSNKFNSGKKINKKELKRQKK